MMEPTIIKTDGAIIKLVPFVTKEGHVLLFDIYVNDRWVGSRRTFAQCLENIRVPFG